MYDNVRYKNYNAKDCRFLACSEIRAANLNGSCNRSYSVLNYFSKGSRNKSRVEDCVRNNATDYTAKYYDHCKSRFLK